MAVQRVQLTSSHASSRTITGRPNDQKTGLFDAASLVPNRLNIPGRAFEGAGGDLRYFRPFRIRGFPGHRTGTEIEYRAPSAEGHGDY